MQTEINVSNLGVVEPEKNTTHQQWVKDKTGRSEHHDLLGERFQT